MKSQQTATSPTKPSPQSSTQASKQSVVKAAQAGNVSSSSSIGSLLEQYHLEDKGGYISQEFQDFGYRLAIALDDLKHKSLYMKMAKSEPRGLLEQALSYVSDAKEVQSKAKLFMWKVNQLKQEKSKLNQKISTSANSFHAQTEPLPSDFSQITSLNPETTLINASRTNPSHVVISQTNPSPANASQTAEHPTGKQSQLFED